MVAEEVIITLSGGAPWGFRLQGGVEHQKPLQVAKVRPINQHIGQNILWFAEWKVENCWIVIEIEYFLSCKSSSSCLRKCFFSVIKLHEAKSCGENFVFVFDIVLPAVIILWAVKHAFCNKHFWGVFSLWGVYRYKLIYTDDLACFQYVIDLVWHSDYSRHAWSCLSWRVMWDSIGLLSKP